MIVARLHVAQSPDGRKYMTGTTVSSWPLKAGVMLVLKRVGDVYELSELGPRDVRVSPEAIAAFVGDIESSAAGGECSQGPSNPSQLSLPRGERHKST